MKLPTETVIPELQAVLEKQVGGFEFRSDLFDGSASDIAAIHQSLGDMMRKDSPNKARSDSEYPRTSRNMTSTASHTITSSVMTSSDGLRAQGISKGNPLSNLSFSPVIYIAENIDCATSDSQATLFSIIQSRKNSTSDAPKPLLVIGIIGKSRISPNSEADDILYVPKPTRQVKFH